LSVAVVVVFKILSLEIGLDLFEGIRTGSLEVSEIISCGLSGDLEFRFDEGIRFLDIVDLGRILSRSKLEI